MRVDTSVDNVNWAEGDYNYTTADGVMDPTFADILAEFVGPANTR